MKDKKGVILTSMMAIMIFITIMLGAYIKSCAQQQQLFNRIAESTKVYYDALSGTSYAKKQFDFDADDNMWKKDDWNQFPLENVLPSADSNVSLNAAPDADEPYILNISVTAEKGPVERTVNFSLYGVSGMWESFVTKWERK